MRVFLEKLGRTDERTDERESIGLRVPRDQKTYGCSACAQPRLSPPSPSLPFAALKVFRPPPTTPPPRVVNDRSIKGV